MTIKEVEEQTGLTRSNIRFYEKEKLLAPARNQSNGYREYSEEEVERIKKIAYLRTLGISVQDIRSILSGQVSLYQILEKQNGLLQEQLTDLNRAKLLCERMLRAEPVSFDELQVERYVPDLPEYWSGYTPVFKLDSVSFLYLWGSLAVWAGLTAICLIIAIFSYAKLPPRIPVQWSGGTAASLADKSFIFAYPAACIVIHVLLKPVLYAKINGRSPHGELITDYLTNYMCFLALSMEVFSLLFINGLVKSIVSVLLLDTIVLIGLLIYGIARLHAEGKKASDPYT